MQSRNLCITKKQNLVYIQFPKLLKLSCCKHIFSTRHGGVSSGDCSSMNLGFSKDTSATNVIENFNILCSAVDINPNNLVLSKQTHTNNVIVVDKSHCGTGITKSEFNDIDGLITNHPHVALVTQYADCTPLLFCDPIKKVVATSHSGWRGTVKEIGKVTIEKMVAEFGCNPNDIICAIGPCIGQCCYEVDKPVYDEFKNLNYIDLDSIFIKKQNQRYMLNLAEANRQILINAGIKPSNIDISDLCTCCNSKDLHSHRATNGKRGNLAAIIQLV